MSAREIGRLVIARVGGVRGARWGSPKAQETPPGTCHPEQSTDGGHLMCLRPVCVCVCVEYDTRLAIDA